MPRVRRAIGTGAMVLLVAASSMFCLDAGVSAAPTTAAQRHSVPKLTGYRQIMVYDSNIIYGSLNGEKTVTYTVNKQGDKQTVHYFGRDFLSYAGSSTRSYVPDLMSLEEVRTPFDTGAYDGCAAFRATLQSDVQHDAGRGAHYNYIDTGDAGNVCLIYRARFQVVMHKTVRNKTGGSCTKTTQSNGPTGSDLVMQLQDNGPEANSPTSRIDVAVIHLPFPPNNPCTTANITAVRDQLHSFDDVHGAAGHLIMGDFNDSSVGSNHTAFPASSGYHHINATDPETNTSCTHCFNGTHPDWVFDEGGSVTDNRLVPDIGNPPSPQGAAHPSSSARAYSDHKGYVFQFNY